MCGRYQFGDVINISELQKIVEQLNKDFSGSVPLSRMKTGEIFPSDTAPVIAFSDEKETPLLMDWGFPKWDSGGLIINVRSETAGEKPLFRESLHKRRCLVPSTGFFEWQHDGASSKKIKYLLRLENEPVLYMAAIYDLFRQKDGSFKTAFAILTTGANRDVAPIHNRMPVVLPGEERHRWLRSTTDPLEMLEHQDSVKLLLSAV